MDSTLSAISKNSKRFRLQKGLTQEALAIGIGVTRSFLFLLEGGKKMPAISTLSKMANVLGVGVGDFFGDQGNSPKFVVIKKKEMRTPLRKSTPFGYSYKPIAVERKNKTIDPFLIRVDPGPDKAKHKFLHKGEEFNIVLEGRLRVVYGDNIFTLEEGDSIYFESSVPHSFRALGKKPVYFLSVTAYK